jgi:hypothetical protein
MSATFCAFRFDRPWTDLKHRATDGTENGNLELFFKSTDIF